MVSEAHFSVGLHDWHATGSPLARHWHDAVASEATRDATRRYAGQADSDRLGCGARPQAASNPRPRLGGLGGLGGSARPVCQNASEPLAAPAAPDGKVLPVTIHLAK